MLPIYLSAIDEKDPKDFFEKLYYEERQRMYSAAYDILKNKQDAEDALHIAFLKLSEKFTKISHLSCHDLRRYLVITIRNTSITIYNRNKKNSESLSAIPEDMPDEADDTLFPDEQAEKLKIALPKLPQIYKDVLVMYYYMEIDTKDIAKQLSISAKAVRKRLSRARMMLRIIMEDEKDD